MNLKNVLKNSWKALPIVSLFRYDIGIDSVKLSFGKLSGHMLYASIPLVYLVGSLASGTPNPLGWKEAIGERGRKTQEYSQLHDRATNCVNTNLDFHPRKWKIKLPRLEEGVLEGIAERCETEEGKIK